jgi:hypothetical protein
MDFKFGVLCNFHTNGLFTDTYDPGFLYKIYFKIILLLLNGKLTILVQ